MAIQPLMAWRAGYSGAVQALRVLTGTTLETTQLGAATGFTATAFDTGIDGPPRHNRIVEFLGDLYAYHNGGTPSVYRFVFGSKTWSSVFTLTNAPNNLDDNTVSGFQVVNVSGELRLYLFWRTSVSTISRTAWTNDGTTWNAGANLTTAAGFFFHKTFVYQSKIYAFGPSASPDALVSYDLVGNSWTKETIVGTALIPVGGSFLNFKGRLLVFSPTQSAIRAPMQFKELVGGGFNDVTFSGGGAPGTMVTVQASARCTPCFAFEEADRIYVIVCEKGTAATGNGPGQMRCFEFIPNGTTPGSSWQENDITTSVIPADWLTGGAFANLFDEHTTVMGYVQTSGTPSTPEVFLWRYRNANVVEQSTFWEWQGNATLMAPVNSDVTIEVQIPSGPNMTGEHIYTEGDFDVTLENPVVLPGKVTFDFQAHTPLDASSPSNKQGRLYYSIGGTDWTVATLHTDAPTVVSGGDAAPTISANLLQGIVVGASKFRATWDAVADGFSGAGNQIELMLDVF